jgi:hypothetical protein
VRILFAPCPPRMFPCSRPPQAGESSSSRASNAAAMCRPGEMNSRSSPSPLSAPSVANCAGTCPPRSSSVAPTNSWFVSRGP